MAAGFREGFVEAHGSASGIWRRGRPGARSSARRPFGAISGGAARHTAPPLTTTGVYARSWLRTKIPQSTLKMSGCFTLRRIDARLDSIERKARRSGHATGRRRT